MGPLVQKLRREGFVAVGKTLRGLFAEESPVAAIAGHFEILAVLNRPAIRVLKARSRVAGKYLSAYLAKSFSRKTRRDILLHHYRFLDERTKPDFYAKILAHPLVLWRQDDAHIPLEIALVSNLGSRYEGELSLVFFAMGISIFELSFAIAPGAVVGSASRDVMLVGRVQGGRRFDLIQRATKACADLSPKYLLMAAAQSLAMALGAGAIAGVGNDEQVANPTIADPFFLFDYDVFWETLMAARTDKNFFELPLPLPQKPLSEVSISHRRRARRKRLYRDGVGLAVAEAFKAKMAFLELYSDA